MKNANWIYESVFPENEEMFKKIEAALGFKLFFWQKAYIITGQFRRYGKTTAEILKELLDVAGTPIDYTKRPSSSREDFYRREAAEKIFIDGKQGKYKSGCIKQELKQG